MGSQGLISALVQDLLLAPVPDLDAAGLARHSLTAARSTLDPEGVWGKFARDLYGAFSVKRLFWVSYQFFVRSGKAVLRSLIAPQVAREFFPLEAVSSPWPVDRRAKRIPLALGQAGVALSRGF